MIVVMNRELLIPNEEYNIGTNYDNETETRIFKLKRITAGGVDLSNLLFKLDLKYANGGVDTANLDTDITDRDINLTWTILKTNLQVPGTVLAQIRALDEAGIQKWASYIGAFFVEDTINTPAKYTGDLSELEKFETQESVRVTAEKARAEAETARDEAEKLRATAESERQTTFEANENTRQTEYEEHIADFDKDRQELKDYVTMSKSYAVGDTDSRSGENTDNSKYYSQIANKEAETAKTWAETASKYSKIAAPSFYLNTDDGKLYMGNAVGVDFVVDDGKIYWAITA